jgi:hypothetical protein
MIRHGKRFVISIKAIKPPASQSWRLLVSGLRFLVYAPKITAFFVFAVIWLGDRKKGKAPYVHFDKTNRWFRQVPVSAYGRVDIECYG